MTAPADPTKCPYCSGSGKLVGFGENVRAARVAKGWSQSELARRTALQNSTINRIEAGSVSPHPSTRRVLRDTLGMESDHD